MFEYICKAMKNKLFIPLESVTLIKLFLQIILCHISISLFCYLIIKSLLRKFENQINYPKWKLYRLIYSTSKVRILIFLYDFGERNREILCGL